MSDQKKINEKLRKQMYRAKLREELGDKEYKKQQAQKKREYRAKVKASKTQPQQQIIKNVVEKVVENVAPEVIKQVSTEAKGKITHFFKPITKEQFLKNVKNEPVKDLIKEMKITIKKSNDKPKNIISDNINEEIEKVMNKKKFETIQPLHVKYEGKKITKSTNEQYLAKLRTVYKLMFGTPIDESIINELEKLFNGKTYNQGIINYLQFFKNINRVIDVIKKKYTKHNTLSTYINAMTSILSRMRDFFPKEYDKIAALNIELSKKYQRERDTNDAPDNVIENLISFDPAYINKLLSGIKNINDKALLAVYLLTPPRRIMDYQLMRITYQTDFNKLDNRYNWVVFENDIPSLFVFLNHKTKKSQPEPKITIPTDLATILNTCISSNDLVKNDFLFGRETTDFKEKYSQPKFTELLQKTFLKYTGKKISVNLIRASKSTHLDSQTISLAERKQIAQQMGHSLSTNLQYSKNIGVKSLNKQPTTTPVKVEQPTVKQNEKRSTRKEVKYF
jgi:hypothetical protein